MARFTNDLRALRMVADPAALYLVDTIVRTLLIIPMMVAITPSLAAWALLPILGLPQTMFVLGGVVPRRSLAVQDRFGDVTTGAYVAFGIYLGTLVWPMIAPGS